MKTMLRYAKAAVMAACICASPLVADAAEETSISLTEAQDLLAAGNGFYQGQQYEEARVAYQELLDAGYDTAPVLYNLGTANARLGNGTVALAHLTRARNLDPRNEDIRANLAYVKSNQGPRLPGDGPESVAVAESVWKRIYGWMTAEEWLLLAWAGLMVLAGGVAVTLLARTARTEAFGRGTAMAGLAAVLLIAVPATAQVYATRVKKMAMVTERTDMLSGPATRFTRINSLAEGQTVRLMKHQADGYVRVKLPDGVTGYVRLDSLARL